MLRAWTRSPDTCLGTCGAPRCFEAISAYSEDRWAAGWLNGIEKELRAAGGLWIVMAAACGGWPIGYEAEHGWQPLTEREGQALLLMTSETPEDQPRREQT
jgi:hypothetical protein